MSRRVFCPECNAANDYPHPIIRCLGETEQSEAQFVLENPDVEGLACYSCKKPLHLDPQDFQDVKFVEANDGYHSWFSQPTAYHTIWHCQASSLLCGHCLHSAKNDCFCMNRRIDIRKPVQR